MTGYSVDIESATLENPNFREVLYTAPHSQLVVMTIEPGEEIGSERHPDHDQFIRVEAGEGEGILDGERHALRNGTALVIPAGTAAQHRQYVVHGPAAPVHDLLAGRASGWDRASDQGRRREGGASPPSLTGGRQPGTDVTCGAL